MTERLGDAEQAELVRAAQTRINPGSLQEREVLDRIDAARDEEARLDRQRERREQRYSGD